jgi:hypothetical protein
MKKSIWIISAVLLLVFTGTFLIACDGFNLDLSGAVWPFEEEADDEIQLNFEAIMADDYKGKYGCKIIMDPDGDGPTPSSSYTVTYYADKSGAIDKEKFTYVKDSDVYSTLKIGEDTYYINDNAGTYSETLDATFILMALAVGNAMQYGVVEFTDEQDRIKWVCQSKTEDVSITNFEGSAEDTIQFIYWDKEFSSEQDLTGTANEYGERMTVNFKKQITPMIAMMYYETVSQAEPSLVTKTVTAYPIFAFDYVITDADFELPAQE